MISILFGAGASYGSERFGIEIPPLGNNLFHELDRLGGCFNKLSGELKNNFLVQGFEAAMLEIPNDSKVLNPLQNELALYLSGFTPSDNSAYVSLFSKISDISKPQLITLNYDLLIEKSLELLQKDIGNNINSYPQLLKLHGSSNFMPDFRNININEISAFGYASFIETDDIKVLKHHEIKPWVEKYHFDSSPVMCMYSKDKRMITCPSYFNMAKKEFINKVSKTKLMIIIGTKYTPHDKHIWDVILSNKKSRIILIDPYPDNDLKKFINKKNRRVKKDEIIEKSFSDSVDDIVKIINTEINKYEKKD